MRALTFIAAFVLTVGSVSGCTSFKPSQLSPQQAIEGQKFVRLTVVEPPDSEFAETIMLKNPWASDVAIGGEVCVKNSAPFLVELLFSSLYTPDYSCGGSRTIALGAIAGLETRRFDAVRTSLHIGIIAAAVGILMVTYAAESR